MARVASRYVCRGYIPSIGADNLIRSGRPMLEDPYLIWFYHAVARSCRRALGICRNQVRSNRDQLRANLPAPTQSRPIVWRRPLTPRHQLN
jgi:hypothetical protein